MQKVIKSYSYDEQREQPLHPSFTSELTSHLRILVTALAFDLNASLPYSDTDAGLQTFPDIRFWWYSIFLFSLKKVI